VPLAWSWLFLWEQNVRIHLDRVEGLGTFVEIEAVAQPASNLERERDQAERLRALLGIEPSQLVPAGYSDLLRGHDRKGTGATQLSRREQRRLRLRWLG
jgi:adenylate cyclase class IV